MAQLPEYRRARAQKREALRALGADPYAVRTPARQLVGVLKAEFEAAEKSATPENPAKIAGRASLSS